MRPEKPQIIVKIGVFIPEGLASIDSYVRQNLNDAICIGIEKNSSVQSFDNVHFLQFITRQCPSEFGYKWENKIVWDDQETHYMRDCSVPRWRTDSAGYPNPFYESAGVHVDHEGYLCIYDQPAYAFGNVNERIIGCTFLIVNNEAFKEVRWSRQYEFINDEYKSTYCYEICDIDILPEWVVHALNDEYKSNDFNSEKKKVIYTLPDCAPPIMKGSEAALLDAGRSVLPPPEHWVLKYDNIFNVLLELPLPMITIPYQNAFCFFKAMKVNYPGNYETLCKLTLSENHIRIENSQSESKESNQQSGAGDDFPSEELESDSETRCSQQ